MKYIVQKPECSGFLLWRKYNIAEKYWEIKERYPCLLYTSKMCIRDSTDTIFYGDRNLYIVGNQMPSYFVYIIVGGLGVCMIGIVIIVLVVRKKKK